MTPLDLVTGALWVVGLAGGIIGFVGLVYYAFAFIRLTADRRRLQRADRSAHMSHGQ